MFNNRIMELNEKSLVDDFVLLQKKQKVIEDEIELIKKQIIAFAKQNNTSFLDGTNKKCSVKEFEKVVYPEDKTKLINLIKAKGVYEQFSSINYFKLGPRILKNEVDKEIIDLIRKEKGFRISLIDKEN